MRQPLFFRTALVMTFSDLRWTRAGPRQRAHMNCTAVHIAAFALFSKLYTAGFHEEGEEADLYVVEEENGIVHTGFFD